MLFIFDNFFLDLKVPFTLCFFVLFSVMVAFVTFNSLPSISIVPMRYFYSVLILFLSFFCILSLFCSVDFVDSLVTQFFVFEANGTSTSQPSIQSNSNQVVISIDDSGIGGAPDDEDDDTSKKSLNLLFLSWFVSLSLSVVIAILFLIEV